ncbi:hypothetical protein CAC42_5170 [Sphaceloma murrayae]|uniref:Wax synthase domain-containing protein n=1 Tax=Sphaceloma murrayae TaxID=2082308 RepID=A0A2K1QUC0_9PEZI|nr:hypothetical protein CAC42_5170 [Sphaceloma murrayae]
MSLISTAPMAAVQAITDTSVEANNEWLRRVTMPGPSSSHEVVRRLEARYESMIATGGYQPFLYPWATLGAGIVILYLLLDHRQSRLLQHLRLPVWLFNLFFSVYTVFYLRARNPASALGVGIISGWSILWTGTMLVFNDCQVDYMRVTRSVKGASTNGSATITTGLGITTTLDNTEGKTEGLRSRVTMQSESPAPQSAMTGKDMYSWQHYPTDSFIKRLDWVLDCFTTFRGVAWNWRISGLAPMPSHVTSNLGSSSKANRPASVRSFDDRPSLIRHNLYLVLRNLLLLDILKTFIAHDPYFWGLTSSPAPGYFPEPLRHPYAIRSIRLVIAMCTMKFALQLIFALGPLFFAGLARNIFTVRAESWDHPDQFGSLSMVAKKGLAGWWGGFWHQTFRKGFEAPAEVVVTYFEIEKKSTLGRVVQLFVAFGLSGLLHACGSMTQIGQTRPLRGPGLFFLLQAVGISLEMGLKMGLKRIGLAQHIPVWVGGVGNFLYAHWWLYLTAPLLVDDFAKGGVWLFEPVPISLFRGPLGQGTREDSFWRWSGTIMSWHSGDTWWTTGIAL